MIVSPKIKGTIPNCLFPYKLNQLPVTRINNNNLLVVTFCQKPHSYDELIDYHR